MGLVIMFAFGETITISRPGGTDPFGDPLPGATHPVDGCVIWQNSSTETMQGRDTIVTSMTVLAPVGSDILATDKVYLPGDDTAKSARWQVNGDPWRIQSPFTGWQPGSQVELLRVQG